MSESQWIGILAVVAGGLCQGSFMLPMKWTHRWDWENTWLVFSFSAYLLCPWLLILATIPHIFQVFGSVGIGTLIVVSMFGVGWGIGAVTFGLGVAAVGLSLGFAVILGLAAFAGAVIPLFVFRHIDFSLLKSLLLGLSLILMLSGVAFCSYAGKWKEHAPESGTNFSYGKGLMICAMSGLLSACGNLGFVFGRTIIDKAQSFGVPDYLAPNLVWALMTLALFVCNVGYAVFLLWKNRTGSNFTKGGTSTNYFYGILMGVLWMGGFFFYGIGARRLGPLGPSLGWAILMSTMVLAANALGLATGEWHGAPSGARSRLGQGLLLLFLAIVGLGYTNQFR
jgi:L-rhamnose-H+ transport protein